MGGVEGALWVGEMSRVPRWPGRGRPMRGATALLLPACVCGMGVRKRGMRERPGRKVVPSQQGFTVRTVAVLALPQPA